jgi:disulfide oxidoreductase YuzD
MNDEELIWEAYENFKSIRSIKELKIKPSSDDINEVARSNDLTINRKLENIPVTEISYTINTNDPYQRTRIDNLKKQIEQNKYISRIIVDSSNTIIEGQHRFQAIKELGFDSIPAVKLFGIDDYLKDREVIEDLLKKENIHSDHRYQLIQMISEIISDENGNIKELYNYEAPRGFERVWNIVIDFINK